MNQRNNTRRMKGIFLEVLMLTFLFAYSWTDINAQGGRSNGQLTISVSPADQFVFRDSDLSAESLLTTVTNFVFSFREIHNLLVDLPGLEISTSAALFVPQSLYNTFYTNTFIGAP